MVLDARLWDTGQTCWGLREPDFSPASLHQAQTIHTRREDAGILRQPTSHTLSLQTLLESRVLNEEHEGGTGSDPESGGGTFRRGRPRGQRTPTLEDSVAGPMTENSRRARARKPAVCEGSPSPRLCGHVTGVLDTHTPWGVRTGRDDGATVQGPRRDV